MTAELVKLDPPFRDQAPDEPWLGPKPPGYLVHIKATPLRSAAPGHARTGLRPWGPTRHGGPGDEVSIPQIGPAYRHH